MQSEGFDAVVIGSGFGGAVTACRLTQAGLRVLVMERGRRYGRGEFPRQFDRPERWTYTEAEPGLLELKPLLTEMLAVQVAGYGGGSLLYNNVQVRPPPSLFAHGWPDGIDRRSLDSYYDLVAYMLDVAALDESQPLGLPERTRRMREVAKRLGRSEQFFLPNLAVNFGPPDELRKNKFGVEQQGCSHCGECVVGCNRHAKNTLDLNYLAVAEAGGAAVRTRCQVHRIEPDGPGYRVSFKDLADGGGLGVVTARRVFVCAGAVSSTELLLRCRDQHGTLRHIGDKLGHGYSANGDFLAFVFRSKEPILPSRGPCITSALLYDRKGHGKSHVWFLLEDGGGPVDVAQQGQALDPQRPKLKTGQELWDDLLRLGGATAAFAPPPDGSAEHSAALLLMGQDYGQGRLQLDPVTGALRMRWDLEPNMALYTAQAQLAADVATALGGEMVLNPTWKQLHQPITIHNLGGCVMADDPAAGVTDAHGEVFGHPGLYVIDGSILPRAIGANPSHTIAAVAERSIEAIIRRITGNPDWQAPEHRLARRIEEPLDKVHVPVGGTKAPEHPMIGIAFKETMAGFLKAGFSPVDDYAAAAHAGREAGERADFTLDILAPDLADFLADRDHTAIASGRVHVHGFTGPQGAHVSAGVFNLFAETGEVDRRLMLYALPFYGVDGKPYLLDGFKDVRDHGTMDVWQANTTLYTVIREGHSRQGAVLASGILKIDIAQVMHLATTLHATGTDDPVEKAAALERFGAAFFGTLWKVYIQPKLPKVGRH